MWERYTERARRVIFWARYEASEFGSPRIETEHLLVGFQGTQGACGPLPAFHHVLESMRRLVREYVAVGEKVSTATDLPLSDESKRVLAFTAEERSAGSATTSGPNICCWDCCVKRNP